jgi:transposase
LAIKKPLAKMYHLFMYERDAFMERYHKRSNIETAYSMIKGEFGSALRSKSDTGQINEVLCKVLAHNICVLIQAMHALNRVVVGCTRVAPFVWER